jgi:uncharacterized protein YkwD/uncharacterized membrane protein required for colicin V production
MNFNWIDAVVVSVIIYNIWEGWEEGMFKLIAELVVFLGSLWAAILFHSKAGSFLSEKFGLPSVWSEVVGYVAVAILADIVLVNIASKLVRLIPKRWFVSKWNKLFGGIASTAKALVMIAFLLLVILALPLRGSIKNDIHNSSLGNKLVFFGDRYGKGLVNFRFITVTPESKERVDLNLDNQRCEYKVDQVAEAQILSLLNSERESRGIEGLSTSPAIAEVSRRHSLDMFIRSYFSHINPEGESSAERLDKAKIVFMVAGENLAYAPDVAAAHKGLMESEGHKKNILDQRFHKAGIGVINGGKCGMMFTQTFSD